MNDKFQKIQTGQYNYFFVNWAYLKLIYEQATMDYHKLKLAH